MEELVKKIIRINLFLLFVIFGLSPIALHTSESQAEYVSDFFSLNKYSYSYPPQNRIFDFSEMTNESQPMKDYIFGFGYLTAENAYTGKERVVKVFENTNADKQGLSFGDLILKRNFLGDIERITVSSYKNDQVRDIEIKKTDLFYSEEKVSKFQKQIDKVSDFGYRSGLLDYYDAYNSAGNIFLEKMSYKDFFNFIAYLIHFFFYFICSLPSILLGVLLFNKIKKMNIFLKIFLPLIIFFVFEIFFTFRLSSDPNINMIISEAMGSGGFIDAAGFSYLFNAFIIALVFYISYMKLLFLKSNYNSQTTPQL